MSKREAEEQISKETETDEDEEESDQNTRTWAKADPEVLASRRIMKVTAPDDKNDSIQRQNPFSKTSLKVISDLPAPGSGFLAYTKVNAFASATGVPIPSPNSQKINPFSSPSPIHNPFMSFVDKKEEFWKTVSNPPNDDTLPVTTVNATPCASNHNSNSNIDIILSSQSTITNGSSKVVESDTASSTVGACDLPPSTSSAVPFTIATSSNPAPPALVPSLTPVSNGEEQELCVYQVRAKLYRLEHQEPSCAPVVTVAQSGVQTDSATNPSEYTNNSDHSEGKLEETVKEIKEENSSSSDKKILSSFDGSEKDTATKVALTNKRLEWIEVGTGPVRFLQTSIRSLESNDEAGVMVYESRVVMRRESQPGGAGTKLLLNLLLRAGVVSVAKIAERAVRLTCVEGDDGGKAKPVSFLLKTQQAQEADKIVSTVNTLLEEKSGEISCT